MIVHNAVVFTGEGLAQDCGSGRRPRQPDPQSRKQSRDHPAAAAPDDDDRREGSRRPSRASTTPTASRSRAGWRSTAWISPARLRSKTWSSEWRRGAERNPGKGWVSGRGWKLDQASRRPARRSTRACRRVPCIWSSEDGRSAWVNLAGLEARQRSAAGTADPENGQIAKDRKGEPTGVLEGDGCDSRRRTLAARSLHATIGCALFGMRLRKHSGSGSPAFRPPPPIRPTSRCSRPRAVTDSVDDAPLPGARSARRTHR